MSENQTRTKGSKLPLEDIIAVGAKKMAEVTGLKPLAVVEAVSVDDGNWRIKIEFIEREGIPNTMDILGLYEAQLNSQGQLLSYARTDMRKRGDTY